MEERFDEQVYSRHEVGEKLSTSIADQGQLCTPQDLATKIGNFNYQFEQKGNEHQYDVLYQRWRARKVKTNGAGGEGRGLESWGETTRRYTEWQEHMKLADRSQFGWATINYYWDDPLASDLKDGTSLNWAEKEARKDAERTASKCRQAAWNGEGTKETCSIPLEWLLSGT